MHLNFDHLKRYTGDDDALISEVLGMFAEQTEMWLRALDPEVDDESWASVAHALKGSASTVGAERLGRLCERAEGMVSENRDEAKREWIKGEIESAVEDVTTDIQRWRHAQGLKALRETG